MSDITVVNTGSFTADDRSWLANQHGTEAPQNATLDISLFTVTNGVIPSGTVIAKVTATGKYGPYNNALSNGQEVAAGILFGSIGVRSGQTQAAAAFLAHCFAIEAKLVGIDSAGKTDLKLVQFL